MAEKGQRGVYQDLDIVGREVRLVKVLRNNNIATIECQLQRFSLATVPKYKALSYAWTDTPATRNIQMNGLPFLVRPNLYSYLQQLNKNGYNGWMFIDAICVNQNDHVEKSRQVSLMGSIYQRAHEVIAWLGTSDDIDNALIHMWQRVSSDEGGMNTLFKEPGDGSVSSELRRDFLHLFLPWSYWSRLWM